MYFGLLSVLAVVSLVLRNYLRPTPKCEVSELDLEDFNKPPPTQSEILEAESKGMLAQKFPHNQGTPTFNFAEMKPIIKAFTKRVKKPENELNEYQKNYITNKINVEKMFQIVQYLCVNNYTTVYIKKGNNCGPRAIALKVFGT